MSNGRIFSKKVVVDGITFDSEMESLYYQELKAAEAKGEISDLLIHPSYTLLASYRNGNNQLIKSITYEPDFVFFDKRKWRWRYVDVKGFETDDFKLKRKLFDFVLLTQDIDSNGINRKSFLEVLKYSKTTGFVPIEDYKKVMKSKRQQLVAEKNHYKKLTEYYDKKEKLKVKEINRIKELMHKPKLTSTEKKRLEQLQEKYKGDIILWQ